MSLDEAIRYYSRLADECRRKANIERYDYMDLKDLAAEHGQLADWLNELKVLREKIQTLLKKQEADKWIPVTERLPEDDDYKAFSYYEDGAVLYCTKDGKIGFGWYYESTREWANEDDISPGEVIAWRPLPEPYQEDEA